MKTLILFLSWLLVVAPVSADSFSAHQLAPVLQVVTGHYNKGPAAGTTPTVVQKTALGCTTATTCSTTSLTTTTGNAVVVGCLVVGSTSVTLSASDATNTYTAVGSANTTNATLNTSQRIFVAQNITGVTHAITCTSSSSDSWSVSVYEVHGASTSAAVDVPGGAGTSGGSGNTATPTFTLPATTFAHDLLIFVSGCANTCSPDGAADAGNSQSDGNGNESETYSKTTTGTYTGQFSQTSGQWTVAGVAITAGS